MQLCIDKQCKRFGEKLRATEFPRNVAKPGGRSSYCKTCMLRRVHEYRRKKKAMEARQRELKPEPIERKPNVLADVQSAIDRGLRTREQIHAETKINYDVLGEALADLVWELKRVRIRRIGSRREFVAA